MRQAWANRKASTAKNETNRQASKLERLAAMWSARVQWWKNPTPKPVAKNEPLTPAGVQLRLASPISQPAPNSDGNTSRTAAAPASSMVDAPVLNGQVDRLQKANTYTGSTVVSSGTLTVSGGVAVGSAVPAGSAAEVADAKSKNAASANAAPEAQIAIQPWNPATPYLAALKAASKEARYEAYLKERPKYANSPAFFVDCGDWFLKEGEPGLGLRILSNLAEMKLEDAPLLRVLAWRMEQAGELDRAIVLFRKAGKLRPEEPQSLRDLALALAERGKAYHAAPDITEAMELLHKMIFSEWQRFDEIEVIGLEELNALIAWTKAQQWDKAPVIPELDARLTQNLDCDVRIVLCWDADNTDVDLHVMEPGGEEAFYGHNRTTIGGLVSRDFTQGYGPEEYLLHGAKPGIYKVFAHYFGSHQQTITGAATVAATVFTDFGRPSEKKQVLTLRLDRPSEKADVGQIEVGGGHEVLQGSTQPGELFRSLRAGQSEDEVEQKVGNAKEVTNGVWTYKAGNRTYRITFTPEKKLSTVVEVLSGGGEMTLVQ
jgi:tetratricopeptide (TPR) repeat protein